MASSLYRRCAHASGLALMMTGIAAARAEDASMSATSSEALHKAQKCDQTLSLEELAAFKAPKAEQTLQDRLQHGFACRLFLSGDRLWRDQGGGRRGSRSDPQRSARIREPGSANHQRPKSVVSEYRGPGDQSGRRQRLCGGRLRRRRKRRFPSSQSERSQIRPKLSASSRMIIRRARPRRNISFRNCPKAVREL